MTHSDSITLLLDLKASDLTFPLDNFVKEGFSKLTGPNKALIFTATYQPKQTICPACGVIASTRPVRAYNVSEILLTPSGHRPRVLSLTKAKYDCTDCGTHFTPNPYFIETGATISSVVKAAIFLDLRVKMSMKDVARRYFVSPAFCWKIRYFGVLLRSEYAPSEVLIILAFSVIGILGSYGVAWFGIRVNTFANSRAAFASLRGKQYPCYDIPLKAGMSIGMLLISVELVLMLAILLFVPAALAGPCFIGFAIGESLGASALRIAGGIFTKIADIGSDMMKIVFKIKEDDARNPGVIADCVGDNAGDSVGPSADGFETYGVTGVALISFILLAVPDAGAQVQLLVWIFAMRIMMVVASVGSYFLNQLIARAKYLTAAKMNFEHPLTFLVWLTSLVSVALTYLVSWLLIPNLGDGSLWWKLSTIITCGTLAGAVIPEMVKVFTSMNSGHVKEIVTASREGGPSLNILAGLTAGNFSAFWMGLVIAALMGGAYFFSTLGLDVHAGGIMQAPAVFAFGLVAFGFLGMGPVTIAVDSYGPVTDNAQSVYELSTIETIPSIKEDIRAKFGFTPDFENAKAYLEENDGAGNTFKATAKPVLIGTAVVGATTMIFSIIVLLTRGLTENLDKLSLLHAP